MTYTQPLLTIILLIAALALVGFPDRIRRKLAATALCGLFLLSWPPVDWLLSRPLESGYPVRPFTVPPGVQALVVFSEGIQPARFERPYPLASPNTYERCLYAAWIYRTSGKLPVLVSGGPPRPGLPPAALAMRDILLGSGVDEPMLWIEDQAPSTRENAIRSAGMLRQHGISRVALVVDAKSMPRAAACLRKAGIEVVPAPSEFRQLGRLGQEILPSWGAIRHNEDTLHETVGMLWYLIRGWI